MGLEDAFEGWVKDTPIEILPLSSTLSGFRFSRSSLITYEKLVRASITVAAFTDGSCLVQFPFHPIVCHSRLSDIQSPIFQHLHAISLFQVMKSFDQAMIETHSFSHFEDRLKL